jgi:hypothetical protein
MKERQSLFRLSTLGQPDELRRHPPIPALPREAVLSSLKRPVSSSFRSSQNELSLDEPRSVCRCFLESTDALRSQAGTRRTSTETGTLPFALLSPFLLSRYPFRSSLHSHLRLPELPASPGRVGVSTGIFEYSEGAERWKEQFPGVSCAFSSFPPLLTRLLTTFPYGQSPPSSRLPPQKAADEAPLTIVNCRPLSSFPSSTPTPCPPYRRPLSSLRHPNHPLDFSIVPRHSHGAHLTTFAEELASLRQAIGEMKLRFGGRMLMASSAAAGYSPSLGGR